LYLGLQHWADSLESFVELLVYEAVGDVSFLAGNFNFTLLLYVLFEDSVLTESNQDIFGGVEELFGADLLAAVDCVEDIRKFFGTSNAISIAVVLSEPHS